MTADLLKKILVSLGTTALIALVAWCFQLNATIAVLSDDLDEVIDVIELLHPRSVSGLELSPVWLTGSSYRKQRLESLRRQAQQIPNQLPPPKGDDDDSAGDDDDSAGDDDDSAGDDDSATEAKPPKLES